MKRIDLSINTAIDYVPRIDLPTEFHRLKALELELHNRIVINEDEKILLKLAMDEAIKQIDERSRKIRLELKLIGKKLKRI